MLDRGNFVHQRPLFRLSETLLGEAKTRRCLAFVAEGKSTWVGQLEDALGSPIAYLQVRRDSFGSLLTPSDSF